MSERRRSTKAVSQGADERARRALVGLVALGVVGIAGVAWFGVADPSQPMPSPSAAHGDRAKSRPDASPPASDFLSGIAGDTAVNRVSIQPSLRVVDCSDGTPIAAATIEFVDAQLSSTANARTAADGGVVLPEDSIWAAGSATAPGYGIAGFERGQNIVGLHRLLELEASFADDLGEISAGAAGTPSDPGMTFQLVLNAIDYQVGESLAARAAVATFSRSMFGKSVPSRAWRVAIAQPLALGGIVRAFAVHGVTGESTYLGFASFRPNDRHVVFRVRKRFRHAGAEWCGVRVRLPQRVVATSLTARLRFNYDRNFSAPPEAYSPKTFDGDSFEMTMLHPPLSNPRVVLRIVTEVGDWTATSPVELLVGRYVDLSPWTTPTTLDLEFLDERGAPRNERIDWRQELVDPPSTYASEFLGPGRVCIRHLPPGRYGILSPFATPRLFEVRPDEPVRVTIAADPDGPSVRFKVLLPRGTSVRFLDPTTRRVVQVASAPTELLTMRPGPYTIEWERADGRVETRAVEVREGEVLDLR